MRWSALCGAVVVGMSSASLAADAPEPSVAQAAPVVEGSLADENAHRLVTSLREGLARDGLSVVPAGSSWPAACGDPSCAAQIATAANATHVVTWQVSVSGRDFEIRMTLHDRNGEVLGVSERSCVICGVQDVRATVVDQAAALAAKLDSADAPARLLITSEPAGAQVYVAGTLLGVTPVKLEMSDGAHAVMLSKDGFISTTRRVTSVGGVDESLAVELQPRPAEPATATATRRGLQVGGAVGVSLGAAMLVTGATFLGLHHRPVRSQCAGEDMDDDGDCRLRFNGVPSGVPLVIVGAAGIAAGVAMLIVHERRSPSSRRARIRPTAAGLAFTF